MARSVVLPVVFRAPWVFSMSMLATDEPRPTWAALMPPRPSPGATEPRMVCESMVWNATRLPLKAVVLTLAMLLPITSMKIWWFFRPAMAEFIERSMVSPLCLRGPVARGVTCGLRSGGVFFVGRNCGGEDGDDVAEGDLILADGELGLAVDHGDSGDLSGYAGGGLDLLAEQGAGLGETLGGKHVHQVLIGLLHLLEGVELRQLGDELLVFQRLERVLVGELGKQQL